MDAVVDRIAVRECRLGCLLEAATRLEVGAQRLRELRMVTQVIAAQHAELLVGEFREQGAVGMCREQAHGSQVVKGAERRGGRLRGEAGGRRLAVRGGQHRKCRVRAARAAVDSIGRNARRDGGEQLRQQRGRRDVCCGKRRRARRRRSVLAARRKLQQEQQAVGLEEQPVAQAEAVQQRAST